LTPEARQARERAWWAMHWLDELRVGYRGVGAADADLRTRRSQSPGRPAEETGDASGENA
jgi:hypothetical protein